ncbi:MAG TPA: DNA alkylation repair protein [Verrucomicrobiae bacterium]
MSFRRAHNALLALANPRKAALLQRFFKTGKGEYGEGDRFLGIMVPAVRRLGRDFQQLSLPDIERLLASSFNEERLLAVVILVERYRRGALDERTAIHRCYLRNRDRINNWNLVDLSAPTLVGSHLLRKPKALLYRLAASKRLWDRRIAVLATFAFIRENDFGDALALARRLLADKHDLMHKACGWMLREIGKRDRAVLDRFLVRHHRSMPRTMLRYAIERLPASQRKAYLQSRVYPLSLGSERRFLIGLSEPMTAAKPRATRRSDPRLSGYGRPHSPLASPTSPG